MALSTLSEALSHIFGHWPVIRVETHRLQVRQELLANALAWLIHNVLLVEPKELLRIE
jgi:hypothetical protein